MKKLVTVLVTVGLVAGAAAPAFAAAAPKTKSACESAHMSWDAVTKTCS